MQDLLTLFGSYHLGGGLFICDRGIVSGRNLKDIKRLHWDTLCGVPLHPVLKKFWRPWADPQQLMQLPNRQRVGHTVFYTCRRPYQLGGVRGHLVLCFNERLQRDVRESRRREVLYAQTQLAQDKSIKPGLERFFDARGHLLSAQLAQVEEFDGYSCLFCTRALPENKMLSLYFNKDIVEKAFRSLKGITQLRPVRHWLAEQVHAHIFVCYLAYLLLSLLQYRLRNTEFTAQSALLELATMYKVYLRDSQHRFKLSRVVALTKKQETILKTIDRALLKAHEDDLYEAMDWLFERKKRIEKKLAAGHLTEGGLVPYDVSSNFYEGAPARGFSPRAFERDHSFLRRCKLPILRFIF